MVDAEGRSAPGGAPVLIGGHCFSDHIEKIESTHVAHEFELLSQVFHSFFKATMRPQVALEAAVAVFQV